MYKLNHIGIVTRSIDDYIANNLHQNIVNDVLDPLQNARLVLLESGTPSVFIELIEPQDETATTWNFLQKRGGGIHHLCYEVKDEAILNEIARSKRIKLFAGPVPALLFDGRKVAFGMDRNREIVEFLISDHESAPSE